MTGGEKTEMGNGTGKDLENLAQKTGDAERPELKCLSWGRPSGERVIEKRVWGRKNRQGAGNYKPDHLFISGTECAGQQM